MAWRARARAAGGDVRGAIAELDVVLGREPRFAEARYNRAAYHARLADLDRAALDLKRALEEGAGDPREVLLDPDFQPHLSDPRFAFLPRAPLDVSLKGPGGSIFVGSAGIMRLVVTGLALEDVEVLVPPLQGPFRLTRVEERVESLPGGDQRLSLTWTVRALGAAQVPIGPIVVRSGPREASTHGETLLALAPDDHRPPESEETPLLRPSQLLATRPTPASVVWRDPAGRLIVKTGRATRVKRTDASATTPIRASYVEDREEVWGLSIWPGPSETATLEVIEGGRTVFEGAP